MAKKLSHEEFIQRVKNVHGDNISVLGKYINKRTDVEVKCNICNHVWNINAELLWNGTGCALCRNHQNPKRRKNAHNEKIRRTHREFVMEMKIKSPEILIKSEYVNNKCSIDCECQICGYTWSTKASNLLHGTGCAKCKKGRPHKTHEDFISQLANINDDIVILDIYKSAFDKVICKCKLCDNEWEAQPCNLLKGTKCPECYHRNNRGENHPSYNHDLTDEEREIRRKYTTYYQWRKQVFERDNYTCQCCGKHGGNLHSHHLNGYHWDKEHRTDVDNGVTLCAECHKEFHRIYGNKYNSKEQFEIFIRREVS